MRKRLLPLALIFLANAGAVSPAFADDGGVAKPVEIDPVIHAATPYGVGRYSWFTISVYDAVLWTDADVWGMDKPFALSLRYDIDIDKQAFIDKSIDEMEGEEPLTDADSNVYRGILAQLMLSVTKGDRLTAIYLPGKVMQIYHNGKLTGQTDNMVFAQRFLDIWLSDKTSAAALRAALLKQN